MGAAALWSDSYLAKLSLEGNLARNRRVPIDVIWSTDELSGCLSGAAPELVLIRVPKQLAYFEYQLSQLSRLLVPGTLVLAAGMDKHLPPTTATLLESYIGPTQRHRGQRKARLFSAQREAWQRPPFSGTKEYYCDELGRHLVSMANVFARDKADIGSRFLLDNLGQLQGVDSLIDLACGNGIIGLNAIKRGLCNTLLFCDESAMAIASARVNAANDSARVKINFHHGDGLLNYDGEPAQLILCNPPFHLNHRVDEGVGRRLLAQASGHLVKGGSLCLVANRHLNYLPLLKREFSTVEKLAQNNKFIIWKAKR